MITIAKHNLPFPLLEEQLHQQQFLLAGCDEVGRGCLAGPVVAGCCLYVPAGPHFDSNDFALWRQLQVTDSKKLSKAQRQHILRAMGLHPERLQLNHVYQLSPYWFLALAAVGPEVIDQINILQASLLAMKQAWMQILQHLQDKPLPVPPWPGEVVIDGQQIFFLASDEQQKINKYGSQFVLRPCPQADKKSLVVAMAAICAKEYRDYYMGQMDDLYPGIFFRQHVGYPTKQHLLALQKQGPTVIHRRSFRGVPRDAIK